MFSGNYPVLDSELTRIIRIVDTKYLATHECLSVNPKSSLDEIEEDLRSEKEPVISRCTRQSWLTHNPADLL